MVWIELSWGIVKVEWLTECLLKRGLLYFLNKASKINQAPSVLPPQTTLNFLLPGMKKKKKEFPPNPLSPWRAFLLWKTCPSSPLGQLRYVLVQCNLQSNAFCPFYPFLFFHAKKTNLHFRGLHFLFRCIGVQVNTANFVFVYLVPPVVTNRLFPSQKIDLYIFNRIQFKSNQALKLLTVLQDRI